MQCNNSDDFAPCPGGREKVYSFWFADREGKGHWKTVGRHSKGVRPVTVRTARGAFPAELAATGVNPIENTAVVPGNS
jgi:hypothetical protein